MPWSRGQTCLPGSSAVATSIALFFLSRLTHDEDGNSRPEVTQETRDCGAIPDTSKRIDPARLELWMSLKVWQKVQSWMDSTLLPCSTTRKALSISRLRHTIFALIDSAPYNYRPTKVDRSSERSLIA